jgi:hypothetical protein
MNQEDNKKLQVKLYKQGDVDFLEFSVGSKTHKLNANSEDNQNEIKAMFCDVIPLLEQESLEFVLEIDENYDNKLLVEVATSYIEDLNKEIQNVRDEILDDEDNDE